MGAVGAGLLAVPVILTMQFLSTSTRPSFGYGVAAMGSLPPQSLATVLFGDIFGSLRLTYDYWGPDWHSVAGGTWTDRATNYLFAGTLPALLLLWHGIAGGRLLAREFRFFLVFGLVALLYALGRYTPGFGLVFDYFPGVDLYRRPADATFLINVFLAFAAGYLVHRYATEGLPRWTLSLARPAGLLLPLVALVLASAAIAGALAFAVPADQTGPALREIALGLAFAMAAIGLMLRMSRSARWRGAAAIALVAVTGGELVLRHAASALNAEPKERYAVFEQMPREQLRGLADPQGGAGRTACGGRISPGRDPRHARPLAECLDGLRPRGHHRLQSPAAGRLRAGGGSRRERRGSRTCGSSRRPSGATSAAWQAFLASNISSSTGRSRSCPAISRACPAAKLLYGTGQMWIYRLNSESPRVYVARKVNPVDSEAALDQQELPEFDRSTEALIDDASMSRLEGTYATPPAAAPASHARHHQLRAQYRDGRGRHRQRRHPRAARHLLSRAGRRPSTGCAAPFCAQICCSEVSRSQEGITSCEFDFRPTSIENLIAAATDLVDGDDETVRTVATAAIQ